MRDWSRILIRSFGIANWFYGLTGTYLWIAGLWFNHIGPNPFEAKAYYFCVVINGLFLFAVLLTGYWLILVRRIGVVVSNYVFLAELLFFVLSYLAALLLVTYGNPCIASVGRNLSNATVMGSIGTVFQFLTAYPLIALVALNLARRDMDRNLCWNVFPPSRP